jgi:hypothetical protein
LPLHWATPGKKMVENEPGADPAASHGRRRINVRKVIEGLFDFAQVHAAEGALPIRFSEAPRILRRDPAEPAMAMPAASRFEPALQFAQPRRNGGIDFKGVPLPVALDLEFEKRWLLEAEYHTGKPPGG